MLKTVEMTERDISSSRGRSGADLARAALRAARDRAAAAGVRRSLPEPNADATATSQHRSDHQPRSLASSIDHLLAECGWRERAAVAGVIGRWQEIIGAEIAAHCRPEQFTAGELTVCADSPAWATQLRLLSATVVGRLNAELGQRTVRRLRVIGPAGPGSGGGRFRVRG